jgi:hypothetical protein
MDGVLPFCLGMVDDKRNPCRDPSCVPIRPACPLAAFAEGRRVARRRDKEGEFDCVRVRVPPRPKVPSFYARFKVPRRAQVVGKNPLSIDDSHFAGTLLPRISSPCRSIGCNHTTWAKSKHRFSQPFHGSRSVEVIGDECTVTEMDHQETKGHKAREQVVAC